MRNINLIFTRHASCGNWNSFELFKLILSIKPDVIFEELSYCNFNKAYEENTLHTVETDAINMYLTTNTSVHIPVDTLPLPELYDEQCDQMYRRITSSRTLDEARQFCNINHNLEHYTARLGFRFLNSKCNDALIEELNRSKELALLRINDRRLLEIYKLESETLSRREDEMLANIYRYSSENQYEQGLFFIGSGHRKSILQKIEAFNKELGLNWTFWDDTEFAFH